MLNTTQAYRIEDSLRSDPELASLWERERDRKIDGEDVGFFVRSVEHVQGDERDLILFGTTYSGVSRNFGPLSRKEKGRRRLNVAITRAKRGMIVLSSLTIDAMAAPHNATDSEGRYLQQYLRYAKAISDNDSEAVTAILNQLNPGCQDIRQRQRYDSPFEQEVAEFLEAHGYQTHSQVGESGFRIDLAVRNADSMGYLCGIECDGARYHSGWKVRANDIWRQKILESKGWKIMRIWSTDWFHNPEQEKARILKELDLLKAKPDSQEGFQITW